MTGSWGAGEASEQVQWMAGFANESRLVLIKKKLNLKSKQKLGEAEVEWQRLDGAIGLEWWRDRMDDGWRGD
jgi:hypothetical protein